MAEPRTMAEESTTTAPATALWVDPSNGAAGDMLLAALLDAGASLSVVEQGVARLAVEPVALKLESVRRHGLRAAHLIVTAPDSGTHRDLAAVTAIITRAALPPAVHAFAVAAFTTLARAEARVHGVPLADIHFHEVGALDAVVDLVGCALALADLGLLDAPTRVVGPVAVGSGVVRTDHGPMPVPVPAVLEILTAAGAPIAAHPATMELCTPSGAALLATLATGWGPPQALVPHAVGVGAGTRDPAGHPNILRVLVGTSASRDSDGTPWQGEPLHRIDTTIDDVDPRVWPDLLEQLRAVGAADAWCTPVLMRKGRPGQLLSVLVAPAQLDLVCRLVFTRTGTLGVRVSTVQRRRLRRDQIALPYGDTAVRVKRGYLGDHLVSVQPEYDDALAVAQRADVPVARVLDEVRAVARTAGPSPEAGALPESGTA
ncbi:nickel pincer cofactor biosynthesis protein LarC [Micromonospora sp. NPDC049102]|uniref:nickel pincer cofactor biosynthesis protein LarC n=1 Tax=Micromonospora sp. NPDC049102 TaxID=3364265 RepID=UPI00371EAB86